MQDHELRRTEPPQVWDNTMRSMLVHCPRKLYFFLRRFDYDATNMPVFFTWGRAFGEAMNAWYGCKPTMPGTEEHRVRLELAEAAAVKCWRDAGAMDSPKGLDTEINLRRKVRGYCDEYPFEDWKFVPSGAEAGWIWPVAGTNWCLGGSLDGYADWPSYGLLFVEHKTTAQYLHEAYVNQYYYSSQIFGYTWYLHRLHNGEGVYGGLVNMVTKNIKGPSSKWKTPEFKRILVKKAPWELDAFEEAFIHDLDHRFVAYWNDWYWPQLGFLDPAQCVGGLGKSKCPFMAICGSAIPHTEAEPKQFNGLVESNEPWEPWKRKGDS